MSQPPVALIGCGQWGRNLARNLAALGTLKVVADPNPVVLEGLRAIYPSVILRPHASEAIQSPDVARRE